LLRLLLQLLTVLIFTEELDQARLLRQRGHVEAAQGNFFVDGRLSCGSVHVLVLEERRGCLLTTLSALMIKVVCDWVGRRCALVQHCHRRAGDRHDLRTILKSRQLPRLRRARVRIRSRNGRPECVVCLLNLLSIIKPASVRILACVLEGSCALYSPCAPVLLAVEQLSMRVDLVQLSRLRWRFLEV